MLTFPAGKNPIPNPFTYVVDVIAGSVEDAWSTVMLSIWAAGLWLTKWAFQIGGALSTPDVSANGPLRSILGITLWISATFALTLMMVQLIVALVRRDGQSFGR